MFRTFDVWKSLIIIPWDKRTFPRNMDTNNKMLMSAAVEDPMVLESYLPAIRGYIRWSKRLGAFTMYFSKQNLIRLKSQFPNITPRSGHGNIERLKEKNKTVNVVKDSIRSIKTSPLPPFNFKMKPLGEYQHRGAYYLTYIQKAALFSDCGTGKSFMVLTSTEEQIKRGMIDKGKTLICVKLATIENCWVDDCAKFTDMKIGVLWSPKTGKKKKEAVLATLNSDEYDLFVINHDGVKVFEKDLIAKDFRKVVVDESTILKSFKGLDFRGKGGVLGKSIMRVAASAPWRVVMSGTPAPNSVEDLWGQFHFLDPEGILLESSIHDFRQSYMEKISFETNTELKVWVDDYKEYKDKEDEDAGRSVTVHKWIPTRDGVRAVSAVVDDVAYRVRIRDHLLELPELTTIKRLVSMSAKQKEHYEDLEEALKTIIADETVETRNKLAQLSKLRQITGGFLIDHKEQPHAIEPNPKIDMLDQLLHEEISSEHKVVIYAQYQWEIRTLEARYKDLGVVTVYGGNSSATNLKNISTFINDKETRIILLHPKSAAHGITLTMAHYMIFYSISYSAEDIYQCTKRIERAGQKMPMFVYYLLCKNTLDTIIFRVLDKKLNNQAKLIDGDLSFNQDQVNSSILSEYLNAKS